MFQTIPPAIMPRLNVFKQFLCLVLLVLILSTIALPTLASEESTQQVSAPSPANASVVVPDISEIIPTSIDLATNLSIQSAYLNKSNNRANDTAAQDTYFSILNRVNSINDKFNRFRKNSENNYLKYFILAGELGEQTEALKKLNKPLAEKIKRLDGWSLDWSIESERWRQWQQHYISERPSAQLSETFLHALNTIQKGQRQVATQIEPMLQLQAQSAEIQTKINILNEDIETLIQTIRLESLFDKSAPIYSTVFFEQFKAQISNIAWNSVSIETWFTIPFDDKHNITYFFLLLVFSISIFTIKKNQQILTDSKTWNFLAFRPIASVLFICSLITAIQLELWEAPKSVTLLNSLIGGLACARLLDYILDARWKKQATYSVMGLYLFTVMLIAFGTSPPIFRVYVLLASVLGLIYCIRWNKKNNANVDTNNEIENKKFRYLLHSITLLLLFIISMEFFGQDGIATYTFKSSIITMTLVVPVLLFFFLIRSAMQWFFTSPIVWKVKLMRNDAAEYARQTTTFIEVLVVFFFLIPAILASWQVYPNLREAISGMLNLGFYIDGLNISIGLIVISALTVSVTLFISKVLPKVVLDESINGKIIERGTRNSISHLLQYFIIIVGFLIAISLYCLDFTKLTIIFGALGVGIGFGLQGIVNNFVCGLVLLFERPLREGDTITISEDLPMGVIKKIGLRATIVQTFDNADMILGINDKMVLGKRNFLNALLKDAFTDGEKLFEFIEQVYTPEMIERIALQHQEGRRLFIGTSHFDSNDLVIWNVGQIAQSNLPNKARLIHQILAASSSMPGVFPPQFIEVEYQGKKYEELHVDGGMAAQMFFQPGNLEYSKISKALGLTKPPQVDIIRNGVLKMPYTAVPDKGVALLSRSVASMIVQQSRGDLYRMLYFSEADNLDLSFTYIDDTFVAKKTSKDMFDLDYMIALFKFAYDKAAQGDLWSKEIPL